MEIPLRHIRHQKSVLSAMGGTALFAVKQRLKIAGAPSPSAGEVSCRLPPRARDLVTDYVRHVGGDPAEYEHTLPPHMFPQWGFGPAAGTLRGIPYPIARFLNGGCRLEINAPLPNDEELLVRASVDEIDDDGRRAVIHQTIVTETASAPNAIVAHVFGVIPLGGGSSDGKKKDKPTVPRDARRVERWKLRSNDGFRFALLTGDFNPIHWVRPYAKAFGFKSTILHGFASMARSYEGLRRDRRARGAPDALRFIDVRFVRPLPLPNEVSLFDKDGELFVAKEPGDRAYASGSFAFKEPSE